MSGSKAVTRREAPVPELAPTPATSITAEDIAIPRLYVGNYMSEAVKHSLVKFGDIYLADHADDEDPEVLWSLGGDPQGVLFHVLHLEKGKSWSAGPGEQLDTFRFEDPDAPADAWTTYKYTLYLPEVSADLPARLLLTKSGRPTAQRINKVLVLNATTGPGYANAFRLTSARRQKGQNEWAIFQASAVGQANIPQANIDAAAALYSVLRPGFEQAARTQPAPDQPGI